MRKIISLGLLALTLSVFSSQAFGGKVEVCEEKKAELQSLRLYGLCNAYWNAEDEEDRLNILENFSRKAPDGYEMPGLSVSCPCWTFNDLVQDIACAALPLMNEVVDPNSDDETGFDLAFFANPALLITPMAGYTPVIPDEQHECFINYPAPLGFTTTVDEDAVCRLDVLDLIAEPPQPEECDPE